MNQAFFKRIFIDDDGTTVRSELADPFALLLGEQLADEAEAMLATADGEPRTDPAPDTTRAATPTGGGSLFDPDHQRGGGLNTSLLVDLTGQLSNPRDVLYRLADQQVHTELQPGNREFERIPSGSNHRRGRQPQRRLKAHEVDALVAAYRGGMTMQDLAESFGIHRVTVSAHLHRHGIALRNQGLDDGDVPEVVRLYEGGWSSARLAEKFDVNARTVLRALRSAGVTIRPRRGWPGSERSLGDRR